jgi:chaperonin GroES
MSQVQVTKLRPLSNRIIVERDASQDKSKGGILLPDKSKEAPQRGTVIAAGPGKMKDGTEERIPMDVKVGDKILFTRYGGHEIELDGKKYLVFNAEEVSAVIEE